MAQNQRTSKLRMEQVAVRRYIEAINEDYQSGNKQEKTQLLNVLEKALKLNRKHINQATKF